MTELILAPFIERMAMHLENCRLGRTKRLIINVPPRSLKSHTASISLVAWWLGHLPSAQIICASYGQDLANKLALDTRKVMQSAWYQEIFSTRLSTDKQAVNDFMTTQEGGRMATSVGGVLTGRGADLIILDDPLKPEDALSEPRREAVNNWYDSTLLSRLNNKNEGCIIIIMQRLHQDDLVGHVMKSDDWTVVSFPAIAEVEEVYELKGILGSFTYKRQVGEPLHAERESLEVLQRMRERTGEYNWASQYQQNPMPEGGAVVKLAWLMEYECLPPVHEISHRIQSWDTAVKTKDMNDYSVCTSWIVARDGRYYLENVVRKKLEFPDLIRAVKEEARRFRPKKILIEDKASGSSLIQDLKRQVVLGVTPYTPPANQDKLMRLVSVSHIFESGKVLLPKHAPWLKDCSRPRVGDEWHHIWCK